MEKKIKLTVEQKVNIVGNSNEVTTAVKMLIGLMEESKILKSKVKIIAKENVFFDETSNMHTLVPCGGAKVGQVGKSINQ